MLFAASDQSITKGHGSPPVGTIGVALVWNLRIKPHECLSDFGKLNFAVLLFCTFAFQLDCISLFYLTRDAYM